MNDKLLDEAQEYLKVKGVLDQNEMLTPEKRTELEELLDEALDAFKPKPKPKMKTYLVEANVKATIREFDIVGAKAEFAKKMHFVGIEAFTFEKMTEKK